MIYIVGGAGYVGSAYSRLCKSRGLPFRVIGRDNWDEFEGTQCDVLINANGNSVKRLADQDPLLEFDQSVRSVEKSLSVIRAGTYVFLSSGDVYPDPSSPTSTDEAIAPNIGAMSRYGLHKHLAEQCVMGVHKNWLIVRMGGFVGPGIRKNAIFDILSGSKVWLSPDSALQFIHTDHAAALVMKLVETGAAREIVNLGAKGCLRLGDLHQACESKSVFDPQAPTVRYELSLRKLEKLVGRLPDTKEDALAFAKGWPASGTYTLE